MEPVIVTYLESASPRDLVPSVKPRGFSMRAIVPPDPAFNARMYREVGGAYLWIDRLAWSEAQWRAWAERVVTYAGELDGELAGYFELAKEPDGAVDIAYFGLLPSFVGRGLGGAMLTEAIERAWAMGASKVCVNTCTLDHPSALANYKARGLRVVKEKVR